MACNTSINSLEPHSPVGIAFELPEAIPNEPAHDNKGKGKLHRIFSSPSLAQLGRRRASSHPYGGRHTLSCVSLASGSSQGNGYPLSPQSRRGGYSTAPTSGPGSPLPDASFFDSDYSPFAVRKVTSRPMTPGAAISALPPDVKPLSAAGKPASAIPELFEDYFSRPINAPQIKRRANLNFWNGMPHEIKINILSYLSPKQLVQTSIVSKDLYKDCFDGQLWTSFDATGFYREIPAQSLAKIIVSAGPFVKDLNLRGCVQVEHYKRTEVVVKACRNLINATLEGCKNFQRATLHDLLKSNQRLATLNLTGLTVVTNRTCMIIAQSCPQIEVLNVSWCTNMDAHGIRAIVLGCPRLRDLRAGEIKGFNSTELAKDIFDTNNLERLVLSGCSDLTDQALKMMFVGEDPEIDILTDIPMVPPRKLRHLDLSRCTRVTSLGVKGMAHLVPNLQGLQLSGCTALTDNALLDVLPTTPRLTHLDLEELAELTNTLLSEHLAKAPCAATLEHLSIGYCENLGDTGMLPVIRACTNLKSIDMDNTRISDLVLLEAAAMVRARSARSKNPQVGLSMVVYDCQNVTWTGIREVLSRNAETKGPKGDSYAPEVVKLKCFYGWQPTVDEHLKRALRSDLPASKRLERKWAEYMMANEEAGTGGAGLRRRRRRAREAAMMIADEEEGGVGMAGIGRRRRARSGATGCSVM